MRTLALMVFVLALTSATAGRPRSQFTPYRSWNSRRYPVWREGDSRFRNCWFGGEVTFAIKNDAPTLTGAKATFNIDLRFPPNQTVLPDGQVVWARNCTIDGTQYREGQAVYPYQDNDRTGVFPDGTPFKQHQNRGPEYVYVWKTWGRYWQVADGPSSSLTIDTENVALGSYNMEVVIYHCRGTDKFIPLGYASTMFAITDQVPFTMSLNQVNDINQADQNFIQNRAIAFSVNLHDPSQYLADADITFNWDFGDKSGTLISRDRSVTHTYLTTGTYKPQVVLMASISNGCGNPTSVVPVDASAAPAVVVMASTPGAVSPAPAQEGDATALDVPASEASPVDDISLAASVLPAEAADTATDTNTDTDGEVATDTTTDTDGEVATDTDTTTDTDGEADTATDTDGEVATDTDTTTDTDGEADTATDTDGEADTATDTDGEADAATDTDTEGAEVASVAPAAEDPAAVPASEDPAIVTPTVNAATLNAAAVDDAAAVEEATAAPVAPATEVPAAAADDDADTAAADETALAADAAAENMIDAVASVAPVAEGDETAGDLAASVAPAVPDVVTVAPAEEVAVVQEADVVVTVALADNVIVPAATESPAVVEAVPAEPAADAEAEIVETVNEVPATAAPAANVVTAPAEGEVAAAMEIETGTEAAQVALVLAKRQAPELTADCMVYRYGSLATSVDIVQGIESVEIVQVANVVSLATELDQNAVDLTISCQGSLPNEVCTIISDADCVSPVETVCRAAMPSPDCQMILRQFFNDSGVFCVNVSLTNGVSLAVASARVSVTVGSNGSTAGTVAAVLGVLVLVCVIGTIALTYRRFKQYRPLREDDATSGMSSSAITSVPLLLWNLLSRQSPGESRPLLQGRMV